MRRSHMMMEIRKVRLWSREKGSVQDEMWGIVVCVGFILFKRKTACAMLRSLVGSEMFVRDGPFPVPSV